MWKNRRVPRVNWIDKLPERGVYDDESWTRKFESDAGIPYSAQKIDEMGGVMVDMALPFIGEAFYDDAVIHLAAMHKIDKRRYQRRGFSKKKTINFQNRMYQTMTLKHLAQRVDAVKARKGTGFLPAAYAVSHFLLKRRLELKRGKLWELRDFVRFQRSNLPIPKYGIDESIQDPKKGYILRLREMIARRGYYRGFYNSQTMLYRLAEDSKLQRQLYQMRNRKAKNGESIGN
jgi:hypothetical protein